MNEHDVAGNVIGECLKQGIREFVVCSGARNLSLISALVSCEDAVVWSHFDERAAGFFALGRMMDSRQPCAIITTSGTAVAELLPAVIESHYQARPLLVMSADRPVKFRGTGAPQAIEQVGIFGNYVEGCIDISDGEIADIFSTWNGARPFHLNVCLTEEIPESSNRTYEVGEWKPARERINVTPLVHFLDEVWKGVVVVLGGLEPEDREDVWHFLKTLKVPVLADATSGLRELLGNLCLADGDKLLTAKKPAKVLRIGDVPVGRFWRDLEHLPEIEVLSLTRTGWSGLARESTVVKGDIGRVIRGIGAVDEIGDVLDIFKGNGRRASRIDELLESYPDSEPSLMRLVSIYASMSESVYLGNSLPIREWNAFAQRDEENPYEMVRANRGANGIDGQLATWAGWTHGIEDAWIVLGDLTTLYDLSAPSLLQDCVAPGRVIVVMNNSGGRIFDRLPRVQKMDSAVRGIIANEHEFSFETWAMMWGWDYLRVDSADDLEIEGGDVPLVVEVIPDEKQTEGFWKAVVKCEV